MILVGRSLDKVAFLRFNALMAEEISSLLAFLKEKTLLLLFYSNYAWVIIVIRNITFTRLRGCSYEKNYPAQAGK